jgi:Skp family chaperone for outer membrane proteins
MTFPEIPVMIRSEGITRTRPALARWWKPAVLGCIVALAALPAAPRNARSAPAAPVIIIVDVQQAQRDSVPGRSLMTQRDKYQQEFQSDFNATRHQLQVSDQDLARQRGTMSQEAYDQKVKLLEQQVVVFQRRTQLAVRALEKSTEAASGELMNTILTITGEIAGEMGATLVLPKQQVVLHEPSMDVTAQVIERLNRRLPTLTFPVPVVEETPAPKTPRK